MRLLPILLLLLALCVASLTSASTKAAKSGEKEEQPTAVPAFRNKMMKPAKGMRFFTNDQCEQSMNRFVEADRARWREAAATAAELRGALNELVSAEEQQAAGPSSVSPSSSAESLRLSSSGSGNTAQPAEAGKRNSVDLKRSSSQNDLKAPVDQSANKDKMSTLAQRLLDQVTVVTKSPLERTRRELMEAIDAGNWRQARLKIPPTKTPDAQVFGCFGSCVYGGWQVNKSAKPIPGSPSASSAAAAADSPSISPISPPEVVSDKCFDTCINILVPEGEAIRNLYYAGLLVPNDERSPLAFIEEVNRGRDPRQVRAEWTNSALPLTTPDSARAKVRGDPEPLTGPLARWKCSGPTPAEKPSLGARLLNKGSKAPKGKDTAEPAWRTASEPTGRRGNDGMPLQTSSAPSALPGRPLLAASSPGVIVALNSVGSSAAGVSSLTASGTSIPGSGKRYSKLKRVDAAQNLWETVGEPGRGRAMSTPARPSDKPVKPLSTPSNMPPLPLASRLINSPPSPNPDAPNTPRPPSPELGSAEELALLANANPRMRRKLKETPKTKEDQ